MDWNAAIEKNHEALKRILASLVAMAGLGDGKATLPRYLHRAVLRLLRPAEAATRRLIIVMARGVTPPPPRLAWSPSPANGGGSRSCQRRRCGSSLAKRGTGTVEGGGGGVIGPDGSAPRPLPFPLVDPLRTPFRRRRPTPVCAPRIAFPGLIDRRPVPPTPMRTDPIDSTRLGLRLAALARALDDLPAHAMRFARWKARNDHARAAGQTRRVSPLRPGPAHSLRRPHSRRRVHEIDEVLRDTHYFAFYAMQPPDTS